MSNQRKIYTTQQSVFTIDELAQLLGEKNRDALKSRLAYYVRKGTFVHVRRGIYAKVSDYNKREASVRITTPSYISFETVLQDAGAIFQYDARIFVASTHSRTVMINKDAIVFRKLKDEILYNSQGLVHDPFVTIASPERAFMDMLYLFPGFGVDNADGIDLNVCAELLPIYNNKRMKKDLFNYQKGL